MIYLDHNATSPYSASVKKYIQEDMLKHWGNPSSEHVLGAELGDDIKLLRSAIAEKIGCSSKSIIFNSGATESINTVLSEDNLNSFGIKRIISSHLEHHATLDRLKYLKEKGWEIQFIENNSEGLINLEHLKSILSEKSKALISLLYANNEIGVINPIKQIGELVHNSGHLFHVDAVQALGKIKFSLEDLDVDFASFSGHKIGSFKGVGCLFVKNIKMQKAILHGGGQERGYRPGTLNYPAIKSFELALNDIFKTNTDEIIHDRFKIEKGLKELNLKINCEKSPRLPNTISVMFPQQNAKEILFQLSRKNIFVSTGSACSSGSFEPSHVLKGLGLSRDEANSCLRISLGAEKFDIEYLLKSISDTLHDNSSYHAEGE